MALHVMIYNYSMNTYEQLGEIFVKILNLDTLHRLMCRLQRIMLQRSLHHSGSVAGATAPIITWSGLSTPLTCLRPVSANPWCRWASILSGFYDTYGLPAWVQVCAGNVQNGQETARRVETSTTELKKHCTGQLWTLPDRYSNGR